MTETEAYGILRRALTDEVMKQERLRVLLAVERKARDLLAALGFPDLFEDESTARQLSLYKEFHHVPGDHLWQAMQFVFRVARDGGNDEDHRLKAHYLSVIYNTLFTSPMTRKQRIPDDWWQTPLGLSCKVVESGIASCQDVLTELQSVE